jgi:hypothetical protein
MAGPITFPTQNALITPAAAPLPGLASIGGLATAPASPASPAPPSQPTILEAERAALRAQKWLLVLSGVALVDLSGTRANGWSHETLLIQPPLNGVLGRAAGEYRITRPPGAEGRDYFIAFQVEQSAPFAAPSAISNPGLSAEFGFAVDNWRLRGEPQPPDAFSGRSLPNLFNGIEVDVAVRNKGATIHRVSYNIALLGKIVFARAQVS